VIAPYLAPLGTALKVHGGKHYLARRIVGVLVGMAARRPVTAYAEPFVGGASVLLAVKPEPRLARIASDLDPAIVNFWEVVARDSTLFTRLAEGIGYSELSFRRALDPRSDPMSIDPAMDSALRTFIRHRMSRGGMGTTFAWSARERGGQPGDLNAWLNALGALPALARRLEGVRWLCTDFRNAIRAADGPRTLFYLDPPYMPLTRSSPGVYGFELTATDHEALLDLARRAKGAVAISGYDNPTYADALRRADGWRVERWSMANHSGQSPRKQRRIECLWHRS
jgi:DNA adenine methylase